ncbi:MAG: hypothetical protein PVG70_04575 [Desulfobacterales bacterium]
MNHSPRHCRTGVHHANPDRRPLSDEQIRIAQQSRNTVGRAAEETVFEDISTGAHNDLARATDIARSMVKEYGMSAKVGQVYFAREKRNQFLNIPMEGAAEYSEATAELIDKEVVDIINQQYAKALQILQQKRETLNKGAEVLLEKEKIEGVELKALMDVTSTDPSEP